jgi:hypothetical protein
MIDASWWGSLGLAAGLCAAGGFILGRAGRLRVAPAADAASPADDAFLRELCARAEQLDLTASVAPGQPVGEVIARCQPLFLGPEGLVCDLLDAVIAPAAAPGARVSCFFPPQRFQGRKVNAFDSTIASVDAVADPPRLLLSRPGELLAVPRRRHARKRVSDQRFIRVRLWLAEPETSPLHFPDAPPDIWVNAYDGSHGEDNAVTNISAGGLALEVREGLVPEGMLPGSAVVVKCSLFQFREKQFKPYWYAGTVRALGASGAAGGQEGRLRRIAVEFTHVGAADGSAPQGVAWSARAVDETQGGRR